MKYSKNILETIGNTPLIRLNSITNNIKPIVLAKVESFNPGNSVKDRMALKMIEDAEDQGKLKKGGTIIEGTSGNTGMGLALASIVKGYKLICVSNDKQSKEKVDILKALGAEVKICPTDVDPEDPKSYYSTASFQHVTSFSTRRGSCERMGIACQNAASTSSSKGVTEQENQPRQSP